ncbi:MAG: dihydroorotate dehydrogenase electron transfer subunit [Candidatus Verstraetearchaeota archaeon]|nr:dihydroorotate dehydrogenase electron transfer subunit [Candidatus Verstraetearchaeota archaeon]RLE55951.1 MAG: dihydroorotate dehydrogenase electron transfer subunit [Candidatus Verstraetearchaeota archaeon]
MKPIPSRIISIVDEALYRKTLTVENEFVARRAKPGQFIMVWIPGIDEIPMSLSRIGKCEISFTVHRIGEATEKLHNMRIGDYIGVRGPYGTCFKKVDGNVLIVGGGTGMAPLMPLITEIAEDGNVKIAVINGGKTAKELLFINTLKEMKHRGKIRKLIFTTNDGTMGIKGTAVDAARKICREWKIDEIYTCGPELMIKELIQVAKEHGIHMQASLERYMKCAIGICGSCVLDPLGLRVCKDGPVFPLEILEKLTELGVYRRDASGRKRRVKH